MIQLARQILTNLWRYTTSVIQAVVIASAIYFPLKATLKSMSTYSALWRGLSKMSYLEFVLAIASFGGVLFIVNILRKTLR